MFERICLKKYRGVEIAFFLLGVSSQEQMKEIALQTSQDAASVFTALAYPYVIYRIDKLIKEKR